jgi:hypothetical protein
MTFQETRQIAEKWVSDEKGLEYAVVPGSLFEDDFSFVFGWTTKRYLETKDEFDALIGFGPVLFDKRKGRFFEYDSSWNMVCIVELLAHHRKSVHQEKVPIKGHFCLDDEMSNKPLPKCW